MIKKVEELRTKLKPDTLRDIYVFECGEIHGCKTGAVESVASRVPD
jgi:hypothetical protein